MQKFYTVPTPTTPEICFSPDENIFLIRGTSCPEDVRTMYYPVIEWIRHFIDDLLDGESNIFTPENPLRFQTDLTYFNSSSAKFIFDIFSELKRLIPSGIPLVIEWFHDTEDIDMLEAGTDIALLAGMEFTYVPKVK
jgi:hypothetical protein